MKFTKDLRPWADCHRMLTSMRSLTVKLDGKDYTEFDLSLDANSHATLEVSSGKRKSKPSASKAAA